MTTANAAFVAYLLGAGKLSEWPPVATCIGCNGPRPNHGSYFCIDCLQAFGCDIGDLYSAEEEALYRKLIRLAEEAARREPVEVKL